MAPKVEDIREPDTMKSLKTELNEKNKEIELLRRQLKNNKKLKEEKTSTKLKKDKFLQYCISASARHKKK